jgi:hypothetical protein
VHVIRLATASGGRNQALKERGQMSVRQLTG